jgi:predicted dehydrogenase
LTRDNPYAQTSWRIKHKYRGGFLTDAGVHNVAAIRMLFGEIKSVASSTQSVNPSIGKLDSLNFLYETEKGVKGAFTFLFSAIGDPEDRLLIFGTKGTLVVTKDRIRLLREGKNNAVISVKKENGIREEFLDFYSAVRAGTKPQSSFAEGYRDLRVILSAVNAGRTGRRLRLPGA